MAHALFNLVGTGLLVATFLIVFGNAAGINAPAFFHLVDARTSGNGYLAGSSSPRRKDSRVERDID